MANWNKILSRGNVDDRRGSGSLLRFGGGGLGIVGIGALIVIKLLSGGDINVSDVMSVLQNVQVNPSALDTSKFEGADSYEIFTSTVLGSTNDMWTSTLAKNNVAYVPPRLVLFRNYTTSDCGGADTAIGPHYCNLDETIYLDETFFDELQKRYGANTGDVAQAYVIAHEVGHHVQNELGILESMDKEMQINPDEANMQSIKLELQADCFAGLWAYSIKDAGVFLPGEITEALDAAAAVGDDNIQSKSGAVRPETWTHGSSLDRVAWFTKGFTNGSLSDCNTFEAI
ncbi:neutral zinc metallopeptidase [Candidatus Nomurabacteria bacterium]|nr:MAG: neutral zinc metallopeptidase [Candidatus Nomurabacteria bacterium]